MKAMVFSVFMGSMLLASSFGQTGLPDGLPAPSGDGSQTIDLSGAPVIHGKGTNLSQAVTGLIENDFCGDAMADGVTASAAARGKAPIAGIGFAKLAEDDYAAMLVSMAEQELAVLCERQAAHLPVDITRLRKITSLLGDTGGDRGTVRGIVWRIAERSSPEWDSVLAQSASYAWINLTIDTTGAANTLDLGRFFLRERGADSPEFRAFVRELPVCNAFARCRGAEDSAELGRFLVEASETCQQVGTAFLIDEVASGESIYDFGEGDAKHFRPGVAGWKGSLQRRRLANRFAAVDLRSRAAAELAADEEDLTDLREVYGEW